MIAALLASRGRPFGATKNFVVKTSYANCSWISVKLSVEISFCLIYGDPPRAFYEVVDGGYDFLLEGLRHIVSWREMQACSFFLRYSSSDVFFSDLRDAFVDSEASQKLSTYHAVRNAVGLASADVVQKPANLDKGYISIR